MFTFSALMTWFFSKLSLRTALIFILLIVLAYAGWHEYNKFYDRAFNAGVASQAKVIAGLKEELKTSQAQTVTAKAKTDGVKKQLATYVQQYNRYITATKIQQAKLAKQQKEQVVNLTRRIDHLNKQLADAQTEFTHALPILFPGDSTCDVPRGIVLLYNASITGTDPTGGFGTTFRLPADAGTPSTVSCGAFARVVLHNNLAAYASRQGVLTWQNWYNFNSKAINAAIEAAKVLPHPVSPSTTLPSGTGPVHPALQQ